MRILKNSLLLLSLSLLLPTICFSQQYTLRDQEEIAYQAQVTLNMYKDLLNVISYKDLASESEIKELIRNSYTDSRNQIFYSAEAIIEDNINPSGLDREHAQDKTIQDYLQYFDLAYEKSDDESIDFYDFEVSNLKYASYLYIKVKYTSLFKGKHKEDSTAYQEVDRLAELRVEKRGNNWKTFITSIVFYNPEYPVSSTRADVELETSEAEGDVLAYYTEKNNTGNASPSNDRIQSVRFSAQREEQDSVFNYHLKAGNKALDEQKLDEAFTAFSEAEKIHPYHQDLQLKLMELAKAQNLQISSTDSKYEYSKLKAERAWAARDYITAKTLFSEALMLKPEDEKLKVAIETLERIIRKNALLESKYAAGEYKEAIKDYTKAIKEDRNNPDYYYGRGRSYEKLNNAKEAFKDYAKAIELDNNFIEALNSRARLYIKTDQLHKAVADYTIIVSNSDYAASFYPERASVKKMLGDYNGAVEDYNAAIQLRPEQADLHFEKGMIFLEPKNFKDAIRAFTEAIEKDQQLTEAFYQRGFAYAALGNLKAASADFERARALGLEEAQLAEIDKLAFHYYVKAEGAMEEKTYNHALESFNDALLISPGFGRAWLRKGDAYVKLEDYDSAIASYDKAVEFDRLSLAYFNRGLAHQQKGDEQSARNDFKTFLPIGQELVARAAKQKGSKKSSPSLQASFAVEMADASYALGYAQLMSLQYPEALQNLDMAIHARNFFPEAYFARGAALYALEDYKKAVRNMEESIKMGLSDPKAFYSLGKAYVANEQLKDAVFSYSHTIKLDPRHEAAYKERAGCYKIFEQYALALEDIKTALSLNEALRQDVEFMTQKGLLELYLNNLREANQSLDQALRLNRNDGWALYGKACALAKENKMEESLETFRKAFQSRQIEWSAIKKDPLIDPVSKEKEFKKLVKTYL